MAHLRAAHKELGRLRTGFEPNDVNQRSGRLAKRGLVDNTLREESTRKCEEDRLNGMDW
jgi:hypothetical protein